jgi:hypothetical protein
VFVTQVRPSLLPDLINMTPKTIAPSETQMSGSVTQPTSPTTSNPTDDDASPSSVPTGDNFGDKDDVSTVVPTGNEQAPLDKYNIKLLMISDSALQQATMTVLHQISDNFGSDICINPND